MKEAPANTGGRIAWWAAGLAIVAGLVYPMATAKTGPVDPTEVASAEAPPAPAAV